MKFEDVKVGDTVLVPKTIALGWRNDRTFYIKETVKRVTKTQFTTSSGVRVKKDTGGIIGKYASVFKEGERKYSYSDEKKVDQTKEYKTFAILMKSVTESRRKVKEISGKLSSSDIFDISSDKAQEVEAELSHLIGLLGIKKEELWVE